MERYSTEPWKLAHEVLFSLLLKFYEPTAGNIYLNGVSYQDLSADSIRGQLGLVTQDAVIFSTTIFENLAYGLDTVDERDLWQALEMVHLKDFVEDRGDIKRAKEEKGRKEWEKKRESRWYH